MFYFLKTIAREIGRNVIAVVVLGGIAVVALAFTEPSVGPTGGTVNAPVNTGGTAQTKSGNFTSSGTLTGSIINSTSQMCLGGSCISSWPVGGSGDITDVFAGTGLGGGGSSGAVTLSLNTGGISSCTNGTTNKIYWSGSQLICGTDQTSAGGSGDITAVYAGTGLSGGGTSGDVTLSADTNYLQRRVSGTCAAGSSIRVINSDGTVACETDDAGSGGLSGSGSTNYVGKWTGASSLGNSQMYDNGSSVGIGTTNPRLKFDVNGGVVASGNLYVRVASGLFAAGEFARFSSDASSLGSSLIGGIGWDSSSNVAGIYMGFANDFRFLRTVTAGADTYGPVRMGTLNIQGSESTDFSPQLTIRTDSNAHLDGNGKTIFFQGTRVSIDANGNVYAVGTKNFKIDHPLDPGRRSLVHAALEGPEAAVLYRGEGQLVNGRGEIALPTYFEALVRKENRTVLLTNIDGGDVLWVETQNGAQIKDGKFVVRSANQHSSQKFNWEVKAVRGDIAPLQVEVDK